tara:strand:+ start:97183 stop:97893 length:711 start_codon:yes stop_codon:yes gene_type:complete
MSNTKTKSDKYLIEFAGLPGVGKSFLLHYLVTELQNSNKKLYLPKVYLVERRWRKVLIKFFVVFSFISQNLSTSLLLLRSFYVRFHFRLVFNWFFVLASVQRMRGFSYGLLDQGIVQAIWSCQYRGVNLKAKLISSAISRVIRKAGITQIIIVEVYADIKHHSNWLSAREEGQSPLEDASPFRLIDLSESISTALETFKELKLEKHFSVEIISYQNTPDKSPNKLVEDILSRLNNS